MYHIKKDKRSQKSAKIISEGLLSCLQEKPLYAITITDISEKAFISRSTFYRLFDNIEDVLTYQLDNIFSDLITAISKGNTRQLYVRALEVCYKNAQLIQYVFSANRFDLLFKTYEKMLDAYNASNKGKDMESTRTQFYYDFSIVAGIIIGSLHAWVKDDQRKSLHELCDTISDSLQHLQNNLIKTH